MDDPNKKLWMAVIEQALLDLEYRPKLSKKFKDIKAREQSLRNAAFIRDKAKFWFFKNPETGIGSLAWICLMLDLDIEAVRKIALLKQGGNT